MGVYIEYIKKGNQKMVVHSNKNNELESTLGSISTAILENVGNGNIEIIFSQGDLNLTPLIIALQTYSNTDNKKDIILGIPKNKFAHLNKVYSNNFNSLLNKDFFYKKFLWCTLEQNKEEGTPIKFNLKQTFEIPKLGTGLYKYNVKMEIQKEYENQTIDNRSFILSFPLTYGLSNIDIYDINISNNYKFRSISPKIIILESVNEVFRNFDSLISIIDDLIKKGIGAVIHFSWPYIKGIDKFINIMNENKYDDKIKIFHIGKRFAMNIKDKIAADILDKAKECSINLALENQPAIKELSIEGNKWESYYPSGSNPENIYICAIINEPIDFKEVDAYFSQTNCLDIRKRNLNRDLREELKNSNISYTWRYFINYILFLDSFINPKYTNMPIQLQNNSYKTGNIFMVIDEKKKQVPESMQPILNQFYSIVLDISTTKNYINIINGIKTPYYNTKNSALISFIINSMFNDSKIIICDFNTNIGFKKYIGDYLKNLFNSIKNNIPLNSAKFLGNDYLVFSPFKNQKIIQNTDFDIIKFESSEDKYKWQFTLTITLKDKNNVIKTVKNKIIIESLNNLENNLINYEIKEYTLLLPGPLPVLSFNGENPLMSNGIDTFLKDFKKIIMFVYKGEDYIKAKKQAFIIKDFLFGNNNSIIKKDLELSYKLNNVDKIRKMIPDNQLLENNETESNLENPIINEIREEYFKNEVNIFPEEYKSLNDIWNSISKNNQYYSSVNHSYTNNQDFLKFKVMYDDGNIEIIDISKGSYLRIINENGKEIMPVEEIGYGDKIAYLESDTKETLDNYFITNYLGLNGIDLEQIMEPFKCLKLFVDTVSKLDFPNKFSESDFENLYWLSPDMKEQLYSNLNFLITLQNTNDNINIIRTFFNNSKIWDTLANSSDNLLSSLHIELEFYRRLNLKSIYKLARALGLKYDYLSFRPLIKGIEKGETKYYFQKDENLCALARLIGYDKIEESYKSINSTGKKIGNVLQLVGFSLKRVISDNIQPFNDMDSFIKNHVKICTIIEKL